VCHVQAWLEKHFGEIDKDTAKALCFLISFTLYHTHRDISTFHRYEHTQVTLATVRKFTSDVVNKISSPREAVDNTQHFVIEVCTPAHMHDVMRTVSPPHLTCCMYTWPR
jgi:hypothetical protein